MAIEGGMRKKLVAGLRLSATYRKVQHTAEVVATEDGTLRFRLSDGREFKSPSAAGSAVMDGIACNGWRFWSLQGAETATEAAPDSEPATAPAQTPDGADAKPRPRCPRCGKQFVGPDQLAHHEANADRLCKAA